MKPELKKNIDHTDGIALLDNIGWLSSIENNAILDENGEIIPWYAYSMIHFLQEKLNLEMYVFEYGAGFSSIFYAKRVKSVISVESRSEFKLWLDSEIQSRELSNINIILEENHDNFINSIELSGKKFDLIVVDSLKRNDCVVKSIDYLKPNGVILLDNSERPQYRKSFDFLESAGFKHLTFKGIKPKCVTFAYSTIFYKSNNIFNI